VRSSIGNVLKDLGDLDGAHEQYEQAIEILMKKLPEGHPDIEKVRQYLDAVKGEINLKSSNQNTLS
jgi:hypothetical protein